MWNFDVLPQENEKMRSFYYFLGTGVQREAGWFRPLTEGVPFPEPDWNNQDKLGLSCAKLRLNWASMLGLPLITIFISQKLF